LEAWAESLGGISYPLLSDFWPHGAVSKKYGVFRSEGYSERAIFIIDKDGIIRYIDIHDIGDQPINQVVFDEIMKIDPESSKGFREKLQVGEPPSGDVVMYCTSWCLDCKKAKVWLTEHQIDFVEVDVNDYPEAGKLVRSWANGNLVTPTFNIRGHIVVDFDEEKLEEIFFH
jgi:glutaredoxin